MLPINKIMILVKEFNTCPESWHDEFKTTMLEDIKGNYSYIHHVISSYQEMSFLRAALHHNNYENTRRFMDMYNILDSTPYYYINYLLETNPKNIIDIGCGDNVFKKSFPDLITGMDPMKDNNYGKIDMIDTFDEKFVEDHENKFDGAIAINSIHFSPINTITQRLLWVNQILRPGSRAFVSFNLETWLMATKRSQIESLFGTVPKFESVINYVNEQILATGLNFLVSDWPVLHITKHSGIRDDYNGNIRLIFSKD